MPLVMEPSWVGRRVSVRRVVDHGAPGYADVVGDLLALDGGSAVVETRGGPVSVPVADVAIARLAPPSTADELALEAIAARGLRAVDTQPLGGWLLRADHGFTRRANSVLPLRQPGIPLDEALAAAHDWYAARGLPLLMHLPVEARRLLAAELAERGWAPQPRVHVFAARLDALRFPAADTPPVHIADTPDDDWLELYRDGGGLSESGRALLTRHDCVGFASLRLDGRTVAVGRGTVDDGWLGVVAVEVEPSYRRHGLATTVMAELRRWAAAHDATRSYLQVWASNAPAVALYEKLGYWVHHDYEHRAEPGSAQDFR